ncbi:MAG: hypothetical protein U0Y82_03660 [Thermoleophilia bacterium]
MPAAVVGLLVLALWVALGARGGGHTRTTSTPSIVVGPGARPKDILLARAGTVEVKLPVDQARITAIAFRPSENTTAVELTPAGPLRYHTAPQNGRPGPERAAVDVGAPAGTLVFAPVDGTVTSVTDWVLRGHVEGVQISIEPQDATDITVVVDHVTPHAGSPKVHVGQAVRAGVTPLGEVVDLTGIIPQELAQYTADAGNHVAIELDRTGSD